MEIRESLLFNVPVRCRTAVLALSALACSAQALAAVRLPVEFHRQKHFLSCEAAALTTVLRYFGVKVDEDEVISRMPFDATEKAGGVWGDPNAGFVGRINGEMGETGYGIHWGPLAKVAENWKKTVVLDGASLADLVSHLDQRRPVIAWGVEGEAKDISWKTPDGRKVFALSTEHTRVVYGYEGKARAPTGFHVMDPLHGPRLWKTREFLKNWESFGRKAVVLFP